MSDEQQNPTTASSEAEHLERSRPGDAVLGRSLSLVRYLREHCAWDARQTPTTLRPYLLEEAHEVAEAILAGDDDALARELGDLLLNVAFQAVLGEERGAFDADTVVRELERKMRDRHPHVYGDAAEAPDWERMKAGHRSAGADDAALGSVDPFDGLPSGIEPLSRALRMQDRAAGLNFDWPSVRGALDKLEEELGELRSILRTDDSAGTGEADPRVEDELGDVLFAAVNVARLAGLHPSTALERASAKFAARFRRLLEVARDEGLDPRRASLEELDVLWERVKAESAPA
jgi:MazG family protein